LYCGNHKTLLEKSFIGIGGVKNMVLKKKSVAGNWGNKCYTTMIKLIVPKQCILFKFPLINVSDTYGFLSTIKPVTGDFTNLK